MSSDSLPFTQDHLNYLNKINEYHSIIIRLEKISKIYSSGDTTVHALKNVSLTIEKGESCAIMGASGSGKSTLMNIVGCLDRPTSGYYYLDNTNVSGLQEAQLAAVRNCKIGFVFQQFNLLPQMTALENVILPMVYAGIATQKRRERATAALEKVGLGNRLHNKPNQLSGGQQQRVAIARAIVNNPLLLLADEPTGALDSQMTQEILGLFQELSDTGITIVIVTHELEVARHCQRTIWFRDGQIYQKL
ncbi:ABC transporter ATP-binding protein [cyanobacterium endosymbiont of Rhopalodia gibberula]|uniref:ABC transporter ATP-binding protein n=1 Tax=cyanobacterium endosymbiont of Rhopalodia gibberula TaxID=1763363 RepID=UPI000DC6D80A|nr:ABC transporter ATP-binding protein [cyanobacterium endosymbiont of Rhopalodia gibberula]BBA79412.1 ABC transporter ATP-binding protein [cyanobacterium endosymbiont of Rhopalodia gibberula]